jgi:phosphoglycerol transferase MdoB-like AlkP superfamily enzyme
MQKTRKAALIILWLLLLYSLLRLLFYLLYFSKNDFSGTELVTVIYWGCRMDVSGIFYLNLIFFIYYFLVQDLISARTGRQVTVLLLSVINLPLLAVNFIDLAYYKFNLRRSTVDLFRVAGDSLHALGAFWKTWWYLFVLFIALSFATVKVFNHVLKENNHRKDGYLKRNLLPCLCFLLVMGLLARGFSDRPIIPSTPLLYLPAQYQSLATNSTITILYSVVRRQTRLKEKRYFPDSGLDSVFTIRHQLNSAEPFNKMNVVVFIMESFGKEYLDDRDPLRTRTPFIDSMMAESIVCSNAYANGLESNKGIVALLGGIPPFFDEPFYYSSYSNNSFRGIGTLLKEEGYNTNFFMGAGYDHFGFARFSKLLGIDNYYSMNDYGNNSHYDGSWGIYDHYFLPFAASQLIKKQSPFLCVIFNISTHFPYKLPDSLKAQFTIKGQGSPQNSISYYDYSLRLFFDIIKKESWYKKTIFVFTADHNVFLHGREKASLYKNFSIPIFFHLPGQRIHQAKDKPVQQLDIIPTVLDLLHYKQPFMSFGQPVSDTGRGIVINHFGDLYQAIDSSYLLGYNEKTEQPAYLYNFKSDTALVKNLLLKGELPDQHAVKMLEHLRAVIQYFNYSMIKNKLYIK